MLIRMQSSRLMRAISNLRVNYHLKVIKEEFPFNDL